MLETEDAARLAELASTDEALRFGDHAREEPIERWVERIGAAMPDLVTTVGAFDGDDLVAAASLSRRSRPRMHHAASVWLVGGVAPGRGREGAAAVLDALLHSADRWLAVVRCEALAVADDPRIDALLVPRGFADEARTIAALEREGALVDERVLGRIRPGFVAPPPPPDDGRFAMPPKRAEPANVHIRRVGPDDAAAMTAIMSSEPVVWGTLQVPLQPIEAWRSRLAANDPSLAVIFGAEVAGRLAANLGLHRTRNARRAHVLHVGMSVHEDYQGMGLGTRLMRAAIDHADADAAKRVELTVYTDNTRALALYTRHGFAREGTRRAVSFRDGTYVDDVVMARVRG